MRRLVNYPLFQVFLVLLLLIIGTGIVAYKIYLSQKNEIKNIQQQKIYAIAELKASQIINWRKERIEDGFEITKNPLITEYLKGFLKNKNNSDNEEAIIKWMLSKTSNFQYENISLIDGQGNLRLSVPIKEDGEIKLDGEAIEEVKRTKRPAFIDLHRDEDGKFIHLSLIVPLISYQGDETTYIGALLLEIDPKQFLYPLIDTWPIPAQTGESLLFRQEGKEIVFLSNPRNYQDYALSYRFKPNEEQVNDIIPSGQKNVLREGLDFRGVPVLSVLIHIPDSPWILTTMINQEEIYAPIHELEKLYLIIFTTLVFIYGFIFLYLWRRQQAEYYRKQYQCELEQQALNRHYEYLTRYANDIILLFDDNLRIIIANERAVSTYGYTLEELNNLESIVLLRSLEARANAEIHMLLKQVNETDGLVYETIHRRKDGTTFPIEVSLRAINVEGKKYYQGIYRDITERKKAEVVLQDQLHFWQRLIDTIPNPIFYKDSNGLYQGCNTAFEAYIGLTKEELVGKSVYDISPKDLADKYFEMDSALFSKPGVQNYESSVVYADGTRHDVIFNKASYLNSNGVITGLVGVIIDITERKQMEERLQYLATHDSLTNIPNRYNLEGNLKRVVAKAKRGRIYFLLLIDLDNFKLVNDTLGHNAGDNVLITLVNILKSHLREEDLLARFGGDEFAILLEGATDEAGKTVAEKLRRIIEESNLCPITCDASYNLTISVGIVKIDGSLDYQKILSRADTALYVAKEKGRNKVIFVDSNIDINTRLTQTNEMVSLIKKTLKENKFVLYYQPIFSVDGSIAHYEVLIRMKNDNGELIAPKDFIPVAERFGLMNQIDRWVIQASLITLQQYHDINLFVNLSGLSLEDDGLLEFIEARILESGVSTSRIGFEITETTAVKDFTRAEGWIKWLKRLGCQFALDDFGMGFSSFTYLRLLPVDYLKIDGSFVRNMDKDPIQRALIQAMNTVAHTLGKKTVAEFVESKDILDALKGLNVDLVQGYYLGKPTPLPDWVSGDRHFSDITLQKIV